MLENQYSYAFEKDSDGGPRSTEKAIPDLLAFSRRLGFTPEQPSTVFEVAMLDFVVRCHLSISWYQKRLHRELWWRRIYFFTSLAVLGLIPVALVLASKHLAPEAGAAATVTTQL